MSDHGPNVTKLITRYMAREAIPPGGGFADGIRFFADADYRKQVMDMSEQAIVAYIACIKSAPDNSYGDDDEVIAAAVLEKLAEKEKQQHG